MNLLRTISSARKRAPTISGVAFPGDPIHSTQSGQWYVDDVAIVGETGTVFYPGADDVGKPVRQKNSNVLVVWSPMDYSPALWLSDTGTNPAQWDDLSGNGMHATQAVGANQPAIVTGAINGRQVRRFDGVNDKLFSPYVVNGLTPSIFAVARRTSFSGLQLCPIVYSGRGGGDPSNLDFLVYSIWASPYTTFSAGPSTRFVNGQSANLNLLGSPTPYYVLSAVRTSAVNITSGDVDLMIGAGRNNTGVIQSQWHINGDIAEILIFPYAVTTTQRQQVERYLSSKYAIPLA